MCEQRRGMCVCEKCLHYIFKYLLLLLLFIIIIIIINVKFLCSIITNNIICGIIYSKYTHFTHKYNYMFVSNVHM